MIGVDHLSFLRWLLWWKRAERMDADALRRHQDRTLESLFRVAAGTKRYAGLDARGTDPLEALQDLPLTEKSHLRDSPESFLPAGSDISKMHKFQTSGSTGVPTRMYADRNVLSYRKAVKIATDMWFGRSPTGLYGHVYFNDFEKDLLLKYTGLFPRVFLSVYDPEEKNMEILRKRRPQVMRGYPSTLFLLSRMNEMGGTRLRLKSAVCDSEVLTDEARRAMEESFSCRVYDHYGSMEASSIARECLDERKMHVDAFSVLVEIVDEKGRPKKSGEGEIVVTPLFNHAMPIIRYRIGDRGSWGKPCSCGSHMPVLRKVEGRMDDYIVLPSGKLRAGKAFYVDLRDLAHVFAYQVEQEAVDRLVFRYEPVASDMPDASKERVKSILSRSCLGEPVKIELEPVRKIPRGRTGKIQTIKSKVR
ncbi:MAG: AMP-binding protein [Candidatus Micrarchaeota archaeon]